MMKFYNGDNQDNQTAMYIIQSTDLDATVGLHQSSSRQPV